MTWRRMAATALLATVVIVCMTGCPTKPPKTPVAPWGADSTWTGAVYTCSVVTTVPKGSIRYVMDWQDAQDTGDVDYASDETAAVTHEWSVAGTYEVKAQAILSSSPAKASDFSPAKTVKVNPNAAPIIDSVTIPTVGIKDAETFITVYGHDPDEDSLRAIVDWPSGDTTTERQPSPCQFTVSHIFTRVETAKVVVRLQDWKGTKSLPDTVRIPIGNEGGVRWWFQDAEQGTMSLSLLVANDGETEVVMSHSWGDQVFYALRVSNGKSKSSTTVPGGEADFVGGPALCEVSGHVIVGSDEGKLYALSLAGLSHVWRWPNDTVIYDQFGAPAINGYDFYVGRENDSLYKFTDAGGSITPGPVYNMDSSTVVDAPAIDVDGSVYVGTDRGTLVKLDANLSSPLWRLQLEPIGEVAGPIIGGDGTVYCATDSFRLYAVTSDGTVKWTQTLDGVGARPALGLSALFVGTDQGTFYSIDPNTGAINWQKHLSDVFGFNTTPLITVNGYLYVQNDNDILYCLNQADGTQIWACDCNASLPFGGRTAGRTWPGKGNKLGLLIDDPNPSMTSTGDILVAGQQALFCVAGYTDRPLDATAPWPKWQKNLSNTGKMLR